MMVRTKGGYERLLAMKRGRNEGWKDSRKEARNDGSND